MYTVLNPRLVSELEFEDAASNDQGRGLEEHGGRDHEGRRHEVRQEPVVQDRLAPSQVGT